MQILYKNQTASFINQSIISIFKKDNKIIERVMIPHNKIDQLIEQCASSHPTITDPAVFADIKSALEYRFTENPVASIQNTYLRDYAIPQIVLFDILANRFPLVLKAQEIVCRKMVALATGMQEICILDLGIGRAIQIKRILEALQTIPSLKKVTLIGVEIQEDSLQFTTALLASLAPSFPFEFVFHPICAPVESVTVETIQPYLPSADTPLFVNASLTLHHVQTMETRKEIFNRVAQWKTSLFTLIEPNTYIFTPHFEERLLNTFEHFGTLYAFINTLDLNADEKAGLKQFFSNELFDAVALPDSHRFEKYDLSKHWCQLAENCNLKSVSLEDQLTGITIPSINIHNDAAGFVNFSFNESDILGVIALEA